LYCSVGLKLGFGAGKGTGLTASASSAAHSNAPLLPIFLLSVLLPLRSTLPIFVRLLLCWPSQTLSRRVLPSLLRQYVLLVRLLWLVIIADDRALNRIDTRFHPGQPGPKSNLVFSLQPSISHNARSHVTGPRSGPASEGKSEDLRYVPTPYRNVFTK
jgi:hypothetical protein